MYVETPTLPRTRFGAAGALFGQPIGIAPRALEHYLARFFTGHQEPRRGPEKLRDLTKPPPGYCPPRPSGHLTTARPAPTPAPAAKPKPTKPRYDARRTGFDIAWMRLEGGDKKAVPLAATAYHEAGHALVARHYGARITRLTIEGSDWGLAQYQVGTAGPAALAGVAIAGALAESIFSGRTISGSDSDREAFHRHVADAAEGIAVMARTRELLRRNWTAVAALAKELAYCERLTAGEVDKTLRAAGFHVA